MVDLFFVYCVFRFLRFKETAPKGSALAVPELPDPSSSDYHKMLRKWCCLLL